MEADWGQSPCASAKGPISDHDRKVAPRRGATSEQHPRPVDGRPAPDAGRLADTLATLRWRACKVLLTGSWIGSWMNKRPRRLVCRCGARILASSSWSICNDDSHATDAARVRFAMVFLGKLRHGGGGFMNALDVLRWLEEDHPDEKLDASFG